MSDISKFYHHLKTFKERLIPILQAIDRKQEIRAIEKNFAKLWTVKQVNPRLPITYFYQYGVKPYWSQIMNRQAEFFLQFSDNIDQLNTGDSIDQEHLLIIKEISVIWSHLNQTTQNNIWKYVIVLARLSQRITEQ